MTRVLGEDHPDTLNSATTWAGAEHAGAAPGGLALHQGTYDWWRRVLGEDHPSALAAAINLGVTLGALGRPRRRWPWTRSP